MILPNLKEAKQRTNKEVVIKTNEYHVDEELKSLGVNKKYFLKTYGCQMNEHDSENIKAILEEMSFTETDVMEDADFILLNTCAIRENAHNKVFGMVGRMKHLRETKPNLITGICGCMAQEETIVEEIMQKYKWLDIVFGTHNIHRLPQIIKEKLEKQKQEIEVFSIEGDIVENIPVKRDSKYKAWINIMYGCDKFCTYCIVPYTRGKQRSRTPEFILNEVRELIEDGYQEITLLGQNVNAYGKDLKIDYNMANLLEDVAKTGIARIRFVTSHPWDFTDEMIEIIKKYDNIMPYIHLPLQSGSDRILKLMGRRYTKESYLKLYKKLKEALPYSSITTDIIVGFPGETEDDFKETLEVVKECEYDSAFTFIFSPRIGTPAAKMDNQVDGIVKKERVKQLLDLSTKLQSEFASWQIGKTLEVLIEEKTLIGGCPYYIGHTKEYVKAALPIEKDTAPDLTNHLVKGLGASLLGQDMLVIFHGNVPAVNRYYERPKN